MPSLEAPQEALSLLPLAQPLSPTPPNSKAKWLSCESRWQRLPQPGLYLGRACISVKGESSEGMEAGCCCCCVAQGCGRKGHREGAGQNERTEAAGRLPVGISAGLAARRAAERKGQRGS